jgi:hypothetical protein
MGFNDPRNATGERNPLPPRFATSREELTGLLELCRAGRIYDVETWIADGRPLQISGTGPRRHGRRQATALEVAMERGNHSLVLLLLANGYDPNQEESSPLDQALRDRRWDLVDLLLDWGEQESTLACS